MSRVWIYLFEDCDLCETKGRYQRVMEDGAVDPEFPCELCKGQGRRSTNMSFPLPYNVIYPSGIDEEMAAGGEPFFP